MACRFAIVGVEGPHDQAFVSKALLLLGFAEYRGEEDKLEPFWEPFIPVYPKAGRLYVRLDMPSILHKDNLSVAVYAGEGSNLGIHLSAIIDNNSQFQNHINAFGLVADADKRSAETVAQQYHDTFHSFYPGLPKEPGVVTPGGIRTGIFVLPNNHDEGVLDTLIIQCGEVIYPKHLNSARNFVESFDAQDKGHWAPFDHDKALVASVASILQPGKTNTVTIKQDHWISTESAVVLSHFIGFLVELLELT